MKDIHSYQHYTLWDFLMDDGFVQWVKSPGPASDAHWAQVRQAFPDKAPLMDQAVALLRQYRFEPAPIAPGITEKIWAQVQQNYAQHQARPRGKIVQGRWWRYAAAAVVLMVLAGIYTWRQDNNRTSLVATRAGEMRRIVLPDSSVILLNQLSTLSFSDRWERGGKREVRLTGEAYFTVQQQADARPFIVYCHKGAIQVLGTAFNVKAHEQHLQVVLEQGAVQLQPEGRAARPVKMQPGELLVMDAQGLRKKKVPAAWHSAWRNNRLEFHNASLPQIFEFLQDKYGWRLPDLPTLRDKRFNGSAPANDPDMLLRKISTVYRLHIVRHADSVWIQPSGDQ